MSDVIERQKDIVARHIRGENEHDWLGAHCRALGKIGTKIISNRPYPGSEEVATSRFAEHNGTQAKNLQA